MTQILERPFFGATCRATGWPGVTGGADCFGEIAGTPCGAAIGGGDPIGATCCCDGSPTGAVATDGEIFWTAAFTSAGVYPALMKVCFAWARVWPRSSAFFIPPSKCTSAGVIGTPTMLAPPRRP